MILDCTCFRLRRLSRQVTQRYDDALRPVGLRVTQFSLLSALRNEGPMTVANLARGLGADTTSITRALAAVAAKNWVLIGEGADKRSKSVGITAEGLALLERARPLWQRAQTEVGEILGSDVHEAFDSQLDALSQRIAVQ
jgi:DNA-binding MarR family transcriptional regulator